MPTADSHLEARSILFVDDESAARKWFVALFGDEFTIVTASTVPEALDILAQRGEAFAVLLTDYRMPEQDGMSLLRRVQRDFGHLVRILVTAYAEKDLAIAAVNEGRVMRILEKPLEEDDTRAVLREALALHRTRALEHALNEGRVSAMRETLGFLAHELNTPLATVRNFVHAVEQRHLAGADIPPGIVQFAENRPGQVMNALRDAGARALYCQSLVSTFVQSARDAYPGAASPSISAAGLVRSLLQEFPFASDERSSVQSCIEEDFDLPGRRDLLYLVLCTLTRNALLALRDRQGPRLRIQVGFDGSRGTPRRPCIAFVDNGPGIAPEVLARLLREPVTTRAKSGGTGMGLLFSQRVMQSLGGAIEVLSPPGQGATIRLWFTPTGAGSGWPTLA
ncbi:response regulator [Caenimonas terrae]|uniref:histidine kinase n=1 Tax=Caenimonas terrae TaxID=696074 RepID=A0ABW0NJA6_9BURK